MKRNKSKTLHNTSMQGCNKVETIVATTTAIRHTHTHTSRENCRFVKECWRSHNSVITKTMKTSERKYKLVRLLIVVREEKEEEMVVIVIAMVVEMSCLLIYYYFQFIMIIEERWEKKVGVQLLHSLRRALLGSFIRTTFILRTKNVLSDFGDILCLPKPEAEVGAARKRAAAGRDFIIL